MAQEKSNPETLEAGPTPLQKLMKPPPARYSPNIIPLIDVLFMLLLYFLLSTRFRQMEGDIPGTLPEVGGVTGSPKNVVTEVEIKLRSTGDKREGCSYELSGVGTTTPEPEQLYKWLAGRRDALGGEGAIGEVQVKIQPGPTVRWGFVVEAFNAAMRAKFKKIGFAPAG